MPAGTVKRSLAPFGAAEVEVFRRGSGAPILLLHGIHDIDPSAPFVTGLAELGEVIAPTHPGFGGSPRSDAFSSVYDLVHHYRAAIDSIGEGVTLIGFSFGGWIAAELAAAGARIGRLVLVDALGIRLGGREEPDIAHFFNTSPAEMRERGWSDPTSRGEGVIGAGWPLALDELPDAELLRLNRSNEALSLYGWRPHMHNPRLRHWLHRINVPTLVLWGEDDRIVTRDYGRRYAELIPGARFETIPRAGHHPELEQPEEFVRHVAAFIAERPRMRERK